MSITPVPTFKINNPPSRGGPKETQCKCCGKGGFKTVDIKHSWKGDTVEIGQECLEKALTVIRFGE